MDPTIEERLRSLRRLIGDTALLAIRCRARGRELSVYAKYEIQNFTGSIKDRMALHIMGLAYARGELPDYERQTDEQALERGCATGLKAYRLWLYDRVDDETEAQKRRDYYTPEEIDAWEG